MSLPPSSREQPRTFYDRISHAYDLIADPSERAIRDVGIQALHLAKGERVLEIGFGTGHGLVGLANAVGSCGRVCGVEISTGMMDVARRRIESTGRRNISLAVADARALCFEAEAFDAVFMSLRWNYSTRRSLEFWPRSGECCGPMAASASLRWPMQSRTGR